MNRLLLILILTLSLQSLTKADDIKDFLQIEGMSLHDSALDFLSKDKLDQRKEIGFVYGDKSFYSATYYDEVFFKAYDAVQLHIKANDSNYTIYSIAGRIYFDNDFNECLNRMDEIALRIKKTFYNAKFLNQGTEVWTTTSGDKVKTKSYFFLLPPGDEIVLECYDQPETVNIIDNLNIAIDSKEFAKWLRKQS